MNVPTVAELWFVFYMFLGAAVVATFSTILLVMLVAWTPGVTFLKAKLKKRPLLAARRRDRKIDFRAVDQYIQGLVTSKEYGGFIIDPDSVFNDRKSGVSVLPVNAETGITLSQKTLGIIDGLKRMGIDNIEEAEAIQHRWGRCECEYEGVMDIEEIKNDDKEVVGYELVCPYHNVSIKMNKKEEEIVNEFEKKRRDRERPAEVPSETPSEQGPEDNEDGHAYPSAGYDVQFQ
jgi:hypothetical protein